MNNKKIPSIQLWFHENKFVAVYKEKAEFFSWFSAKQCTIIKKQCTIIKIDSKLTQEFLPNTSEHISDAFFTVGNIIPKKKKKKKTT